jgi:hypothetical protein
VTVAVATAPEVGVAVADPVPGVAVRVRVGVAIAEVAVRVGVAICGVAVRVGVCIVVPEVGVAVGVACAKPEAATDVAAAKQSATSFLFINRSLSPAPPVLRASRLEDPKFKAAKGPQNCSSRGGYSRCLPEDEKRFRGQSGSAGNRNGARIIAREFRTAIHSGGFQCSRG